MSASMGAFKPELVHDRERLESDQPARRSGSPKGGATNSGVRPRRLHQAETSGLTTDDDPSRDRSVAIAFAEVAEAITDDMELDTLLHLVAGKMRALVGIARCSVYLRDGQTEFFRGQVGETGKDDDERIKRLVCGVEADGFTREILATQVPVLIADAQHDPRPVRATMRAWHLRSILGVPMIMRQEVIGLLFLDNADAPHEFVDAEIEIAATFANLAAIAIRQADSRRQLHDSLEAVARKNVALRRTATIEARLTELALEGGSLVDLATSVAQLTSKPCAIHDDKYRLLATGRPPGVNVAVQSVLEPRYRDIPSVAEALATKSPSRPTVVGPFPTAGLPHRSLITSVTVRRETRGYLVLMESGTRLTTTDAVVAKRAAMIVALELSAERRAATASSDARTMLIRALVAGSDVDAAIYRRAEQYGLKINEPHVVCVLSCVESSDDDSLALLDLESALRGIDASSEGWAATVERRVVLILGIDSPLDHPTAVHDATAVVARIVKQLAPDGGLTAGISGVCAQREDYRRGYQEACDVRSLLDTVFAGPNRPSVLAAADLGPGRLMLSMTDQDGAQRFARDTLGSLLALQPEKPDSLLNTLLVFFAASRCVRDAAQWMEVHENTIRYRLTRIAKVTGLDIANDADAQLSVQLAMLVLQFAGELSQPVRPPALQGP